MQNSVFKPSVRYLDDLEIYFVTKNSVQVRAQKACISIVRWDKVGGGRYSSAWRPFCQKIQRLNNLSFHQIINIATSYGLMVFKSRRPIAPPAGIWVRPTIYKYPRKKSPNVRSVQTNKD